MDQRWAQAAQNNAEWCDTVCRAHGRPGAFLDALWINRHEVPRVYPNAVTLSDGVDAPRQIAQLRDLVDAGIPGNWGVKDSFAALDLAPMGFRILFEAEWIYRPPTRLHETHDRSGLRWVRVDDPTALEQWERAWSGELEPGSQRPRVFPPALLADERIAIVAGYDGGQIVAGAVANRSGDVAGISNLFVASGEANIRAPCVAALGAAFPGLPLVGYESGEDLVTMRAVGFERVGPLTVWVRR